jgi:hypothetical protein
MSLFFHTCGVLYVLTLPIFSIFAAMLYCSEDEEFIDEDFFQACGPPVFCLWHGVLFCYLDLLVL